MASEMKAACMWATITPEVERMPRRAHQIDFKMLRDKLIKWFSRPTPDRATNVTAALPFALATDIGLVRTENQDRIGAFRACPDTANGESFLVVAISDGMGGMRDGGICASYTLAAFFAGMASGEIADPFERLRAAAEQANLAVFDQYGGDGGATLSAICWKSDGAGVSVNVGDSRIYGVREQGSPPVQRLTVDDSLEEAVGGHGRELLQFVGMGSGLTAHLSELPYETSRVLITSDGIHFVSHEALCDVLWKAPDIYRTAERLSAFARWCGGPDNASLAAVDLRRLPEIFHTTTDVTLTVWDPFGSVEYQYLPPLQGRDRPQKNDNSETKKLRAASENSASEPDTRQARQKRTRKRKPKDPSKQDQSTGKGPQLVIQIDDTSDSTASEKKQ